MISLTNATKGRYLVLTETAEYLLDLNARTAVRTLRTVPDNSISPDVPASQVKLRNDGQEIPIVSLDPVVVGRPLAFSTFVSEDPNVYTWRRTTTVCDIISLDLETELLHD